MCSSLTAVSFGSLLGMSPKIDGRRDMQILDGVAGEVLALKGDTLLGLDTNYTNPPDVTWPLTFGNLAASTLLPLRYPNYTAEVKI